MSESVKPGPEKPWPPGYRINPRVTDLPVELLRAFAAVPTAHASDCLGRTIGAIGLHAFHKLGSGVLCGRALTVRIRPGDNLMIHIAIALAQPDDVMVIDGGGAVSQAVIGGLMRTSAIERGIRGYVLDGALRDVGEWAEGGIFAYAKGFTHRGPTKDGPGEINVPIACAGMAVAPGDLILGDADGVIAVPRHEVAALLPLVLAHAKREVSIREKNAARTSDPERFYASLRAKGCPV